FFVLLDEIKRMEIARDLRYFGGYFLRQIKVFSNIIGVLLIRSIERSERVYYAMKLRGYDKEIKTLLEFQIELKELLLFGFISSMVILIRIFI
ncbi:MAG: hypothetical protein H5U37_06930, partial [Caldisericia bacterium]|nr:hypothetical protein [Caldisericia bacterium]